MQHSPFFMVGGLGVRVRLPIRSDVANRIRKMRLPENALNLDYTGIFVDC
jgi:hypothetical protein